jgi:hypothetical protein
MSELVYNPAPAKLAKSAHITARVLVEVPDAYGRPRFSVDDVTFLAFSLQRWAVKGDRMPYTATSSTPTGSPLTSSRTPAVFWACSSKANAELHKREVQRLRGKKATITLTPRRYSFYPDSGGLTSGISLTLNTIEEYVEPTLTTPLLAGRDRTPGGP